MDDISILLFEIFIAAILTVFTYLLFPVIYVLKNGKTSKKKAKKIAIINGIIVFFLWTLINLGIAEEIGNVSSAFIWSFVAYAILKGKNEDELMDILLESQPKNNPENDELRHDAFCGYVFGKYASYDLYINDHFQTDNLQLSLQWAKEKLDYAFEIINSGKTTTYDRVGAFNVFDNQELTPLNNVMMDLFEVLIFGDNDFNINRSDEIPYDIKCSIKYDSWAVVSVLSLFLSEECAGLANYWRNINKYFSL